ncbi:MAG: methylmalonyl-CoA mutase [Chloroflexi bacterium CG_4_9_14_3_um_filter_45_9]|nr:MAG: methylmalonyl-CoA mutase [Chloroflexi bacterium CG23_combo_of_CG06-09_8_20_14_all_45_10]PJB51406.1 MAG: methylmalonyl-CoA mutase [Chloroflexi bacterium CG_4_9_14_3_um_filter_45_9]
MAIRVLLTADETGHSMGYHTIATALRDAGIEVILGGTQIPREIAHTAIQEDVDVIAYRIMGAHPPTLVSRLVKVLKEQGADNIPIVVGGAILPKQEEQLREMGVLRIFPLGCSLESVISFFVKFSENKHSSNVS